MSYIGNEPPDIGAYGVESFDGGGTSFTLSKPSTTATVLLFIDGVRQTPVDAYSVSGVTLTTTGTTPAGTDNVTVQFLGDVVDFGEPSDDSVSATKIQDDAVTTDKILDDAVTADKLANSINTEIAANTAKVTNATHTGDVTGATALTIAADAVDIAMLSATGTADATTFLRGDNAWAAPAGGNNTPAFQAYLSGNQTIAYDSSTKVTFDTEDFDTDSAYDNTTNYRFTVPSGEGGKYYVYFRTSGGASSSSNHNKSYSYIQVNGSNVSWATFDDQANGKGETVSYYNAIILTLAAADYVECWFYLDTANGAAGRLLEHEKGTMFGAYKMIGL